MLEYINLCLLFALIFYLYSRVKKYFPILKLAEEIFSGYNETTQAIATQAQSDTKCQKLLECVLTGNSKLYLGKVYTEEKIQELNEEEVEKLLIITKLNSQVRW